VLERTIIIDEKLYKKERKKERKKKNICKTSDNNVTQESHWGMRGMARKLRDLITVLQK